MSKFKENLNFYIIKYLLKINKLINRNGLYEKEGYCGIGDIKNKLNCKKLSIQLYENDDKNELFKILALLSESGIEIELIEFNRILENKDIETLRQISPNIRVNFRYMLDSNYSGENVETSYDVESYSKILDKIEYLTNTAKINFSQTEEQIMFITNQISEYISFYNKYNELDEEQFKQKSSLKGAFLERQTVCIGYAMAFERCMSNLGVENKIIQGEGNFNGRSKIAPWDANHAWNVVKIKGKWYNVDVTWLSSYIYNVDLENTEVSESIEKDIIKNYILTDDVNFENHYKLENNGINCKEPLKNRFEIYEKVKRYKSVLEEYDKGKRNNMLQIKLKSDSTNNSDLRARDEKGINQEGEEIQ